MKKSVFKIFVLLISLLMVLSIFTACGEKETSGGSGSSGSGSSGSSSGGSSGGGSEQKKDGYDGPVMTVRVGTMVPVTGTSARTGEMQHAVVQAALEHIAEDNYLNPAYELEFLEFVDDESSTDRAPVAANLCIQGDPHVAIGHHLTTMIMISAPLFEEAAIPLIGMISGPKPATMGWQYFHYGTVTDVDAAIALMDYLINIRSFKRFLVVGRDDEGGMIGAEACIKLIKDAGLSFDDKSQYVLFNTSDIDFSSQAMQAKVVQPDCILTYGLGGANLLTFFDQVEQMYGPIPETTFICGSTSAAQPTMKTEFIPEGTKENRKLQGIVFPTGFIQDDSDPFRARFMKRFDELDPVDNFLPGDNQARCYDAIWNIATALNMMAENDGYLHPDKDKNFRERLNYWISQIDRQGVQGHIEYKAFTDGRIIKDANIGEWQANGSMKQVYP